MFVGQGYYLSSLKDRSRIKHGEQENKVETIDQCGSLPLTIFNSDDFLRLLMAAVLLLSNLGDSLG